MRLKWPLLRVSEATQPWLIPSNIPKEMAKRNDLNL